MKLLTSMLFIQANILICLTKRMGIIVKSLICSLLIYIIFILCLTERRTVNQTFIG